MAAAATSFKASKTELLNGKAVKNHLLYPSCPKTGSHTPKNEKIIWPAISYKILTLHFQSHIPGSWNYYTLLSMEVSIHGSTKSQEHEFGGYSKN